MHYFIQTLNSRQFRIVMSKDARNWGFAVIRLPFVDLSLLMNYVRHDFKSFSLAHWFTDQVLIRSYRQVPQRRGSDFNYFWWCCFCCSEWGLGEAWASHCSGFSCRGDRL